jgi:RNA methyltransferase, TrmH family
MQRITSSDNSIIKEIKSLKEKKYRTEKGLYIIEGIKLLEEALDEKVAFKYVIMNDSFADSFEGSSLGEKFLLLNNLIYIVPDKLFREASDTLNPQGILAVVEKKHYNLKEGIFSGIASNNPSGNAFWIIADSIQDPGNLGSIIRTADAAGVTGMVISIGCADPYNPKVIRSTMGSIFRIPLFFCKDLYLSLQYLKENGTRLYASHLKGSCEYYDADFKGNIALIIGNEAAGISEVSTRCSDLLIKIPMPGRAESLNAAAAAAILMYEVVRQRNNS